MQCPTCKNTTSEAGHAFCFKCGTKLETNEETSSPPVHNVTEDAKELSREAQKSKVDNNSDAPLGKILLLFSPLPTKSAKPDCRSKRSFSEEKFTWTKIIRHEVLFNELKMLLSLSHR